MRGGIMATKTVSAATVLKREHRFFFISACIMAFVLVAGFSTNILFQRSSFAAPILYHVHAVAFFGWVVLYLLQTGLVATGSTRLHKQLGWLALACDGLARDGDHDSRHSRIWRPLLLCP